MALAISVLGVWHKVSGRPFDGNHLCWILGRDGSYCSYSRILQEGKSEGNELHLKFSDTLKSTT